MFLTIGVAVEAQSAPTSDGIAIGKRLVAAIKGKAEFQDADFARPLRDGDKSALRQFATCRVTRVNYTATTLPARPNVLVQDPNHVGIGFDCRGVSDSTPVGISLRLQAGKIMKIETHNADLMRVDH